MTGIRMVTLLVYVRYVDYNLAVVPYRWQQPRVATERKTLPKRFFV